MHAVRNGVLILIAILSAITATPVLHAQSGEQQLKVVEHIWGFDGRVQPGQFNPLSILLDNQTDEPIDAVASLQRIQGLLNPTGGHYVQQVFIAPAARRWIQFYPYVATSQQDEWRLAFDGKKLQDFTQPRSAIKAPTEKEDQPPQMIILDRANRFSTQPSSVKHLPENIFPPYATATTGLHTVFLDHVPDWETPRQQAFISWLKQGGRLHLLKDGRGEFPRFSGELTSLNQPFDRFAVERGVVLRHDIQRRDVTEDIVDRAQVVDALKGEDAEFEKAIQEQAQNNAYNLNQFTETEPAQVDASFFREMRELTLPEHAWWLIFLLALCYIGLIFPGCYILSKNKELHFLATYGAIVGLSVVFSVLFLIIGRRGYGETTTLQTLAIARAEDATHWNVFQWNALFVTSGDNYLAAADNQQAVFSTADTSDSADARIVPGNKGQIAMRIPPFSSQTFVSRRHVSTGDWKLKVLNYEGGPTGIVQLSLSTGPEFPAAEDAEYLVLSGRQLYTLRYIEDSGHLQLFGSKNTLAKYCQSEIINTFANPWNQQNNRDERPPAKKFFDESLPVLVQRSLLDDLVNKPTRFELPAERLRLFVYTPVPDNMALNVNTDARSSGRILYVKDILMSESK